MVSGLALMPRKNMPTQPLVRQSGEAANLDIPYNWMLFLKA